MTVLPSIVAGMVSSPDAFLSQPVIITVPSLILYFKLGLRGISLTALVSALCSISIIFPAIEALLSIIFNSILSAGLGFEDVD